VFELLAQNNGVRIERIISKGQKSPDTGWYDQDESEWVMVLRGAAAISFESGTVLNLTEGDYVQIEPHEKHKVTNTSTNPETIWLAIHY
ncbi:MAG: cupin domain-containing protein, partial [Gammaproteobacteria bacterium]|nr:cupin domain-containing protein [Gammaproteobacteria bacterium]